MTIRNLKCYEKMLIIVDMVNGFVKDGDLHDKEIARIVPRQEELIKEYQKEKQLVVFIKDTHTKDSKEHERFNPLQHCIKGSGEENVIEELKKYEDMKNTVSIEKNSTSFMEAPAFRNLVHQTSELKQIDIVGCCTDICVFNGTMGLANYLDEWNKYVEVKVHEDAIATFAEDGRSDYIEAAKLLMKQQGITLVKKK